MVRNAMVLCAMVLLVTPTLAGPREWSDDFSAAKTYDSDSLYAPCYGGPSTKYTAIEVTLGDIYNERSVSGGGRLRFSNKSTSTLIPSVARIELTIIGVVDVGQWCPDNPSPAPGASLITSAPFTGAQVCVYGGFSLIPMELLGGGTMYGPDGQPGVAGVDDDGDGVTDEANESPFRAPITTGSGYGPPFPGGVDRRPGVANVDDDGNGTTDDVGETGWTGSDDGDDGRYLPLKGPMTKMNLATTSGMYVWIQTGAPYVGSLFSLYHFVGGTGTRIERSEEIAPGFYRPNTRYNYVFCSSGTSHGAMLWTGADMANPDETVGPVLNSQHTAAGDNGCGLYNAVTFEADDDSKVYLRNHAHLGNGNFSDTYWVISGPPETCYPSPSADLDRDKDVDGFDFLTFSNCYNGSNKPPQGACVSLLADLDRDGDVDGFDFLTFSNCYNGSNRRPLSACFPPNVTSGTAPANNTCSGAVPVSEGSVIDRVTGLVTRTFNHGCAPGPELWYKYTPTCTGTATLSLCEPPSGLGYALDWLAIALYDGCPDAGGSEIICQNIDNCAGRETVTVSVEAGVPVYVAVIQTATSHTGVLKLTITCSP